MKKQIYLFLIFLITVISLDLRAQSLNGGTGCTPSVLTLTSGLPPTQIVWELNGSVVGTVTPAIITVAGGNGPGSGANQFNGPNGLFVDGSGNVYVSDFENSRVQKWAPGAASGTTVAGGSGNGAGANQLNSPYGVFVDGSGNVYVADAGNNRIQKWVPGAGTGVTVAGASGGLNSPQGIFVDGSGNMYIADGNNERILKWTPGAMSGTVVAGGNGNGSAANQLSAPNSVYVDGSGNMYISDLFNDRIQKWAPGATSGITVAGGNGYGSGANQFEFPQAVYVDGSANIYVADLQNNRIQKWAPGATSGTTVGTGLSSPEGVYVDGSGNVYAADQGNNRVQEYSFFISGTPTYNAVVAGNYTALVTTAGGTNATNTVTVNASPGPITGSNIIFGTGTTTSLNDIIGGGAWSSASPAVAIVNSTGVATGAATGTAVISYVLPDGCAATITVSVEAAATLSGAGICTPDIMTVTSSAQPSQIVWTTEGIGISTVTPTFGVNAITVAGGNGAGSSANQLNEPMGVYVDGNGNIYVEDFQNSRVQEWAPGATAGITVAGGNGAGSAANQLNWPRSIYVDGSGNIYVADAINMRVQKWAPGATAGITVAGTGVYGSGANQLAYPYGVVVDANGNLFVVDADNERVQEWAPGATAGITVAGGNGQGSGANQLSNPGGVAVDANGNIYVSDFQNNRVQKWAPGASSGITVAGTTTPGVFVDGIGNIYNVDYISSHVLKYAPGALSGITVACTGGIGSGANQLNNPQTVCVDANGNIYVSDMGNNRVQEFTASMVMTYNATVAGNITATVTTEAGNSSTTNSIHIYAGNAGIITGNPSSCTGSTTSLLDTTLGGTWSSSNGTATVGSTGIVTFITPGIDTITYTITDVCGTFTTTKAVTGISSLTAINGTAVICAGLTTSLSDATAGGTWTSGSTGIATVDASGHVSGLSAGTAVIYYTLSGGCNSSKIVTVNPLAIVTGAASVCTGATTLYSANITGGTWASSGPASATVGLTTGVVTGVAAGIPNITYALPTGCKTISNILVNSSPTAIVGTAIVCTGLTTSLSDLTTGGTWSAAGSNASVGIGAGTTMGITPGTAVISYTLPTGCYKTVVVTVNQSPTAIAGVPSSILCAGITTTLSDGTTSGLWASSAATVTVIASTGVITGVSAGTANISYTLPSGCRATAIVTAGALPAAISGTASVCTGATTSLTDAITGGTWSAAGSNASVGIGAGITTGLSAGTSVISYILPTGCYKTVVVTVNQSPAAIAGVPTSILCAGISTTLSDGTTGGAWASSAATVTVVASTGVITGVSAGTANISYILPSGCRATAIVTAGALPAAISGTASVCTGATTSLSDAITGGTWSAAGSNASVGIGAGTTTGVSAGTSVISYILPTGCYKTVVVTVNPQPPGISGVPTTILCAGTITTLSDGITGGTWTSSLATVASVATTGVVTGVATGTTTISYTLPGGCRATAIVTAGALPAAISGVASVCTGLTTSLSDVTAGGSWSAGGSNASVGIGAGTTTGVSAGTSVISYILPTGCYKTVVVTVNQSPAAISGVPTSVLCAGITAMLSDGTTGGAWASSAATVTVVASTGVITGVSAGTANISYTLPSGCRATAIVTAGALPAAISGTASVCTGATTSLTDAITGGTWSAAGSNASVGIGAGTTTGVSAGTSVISYILPTGCYKTVVVTVNPQPPGISGVPTTVLCAGITTTLSDVVAGGTWTSSLVTVASVATTGVVTGVATGTTTISYTLPGGCRATAIVTAGALPAAISGVASVCTGLTTSLSDLTTGGTWSAGGSNASVGIGAGTTTGVSVGTSVISYILPTGCYKTVVVTVNPQPPGISGVPTTILCAGTITTLSDGITGGTWTSSLSTVASVATTGVVTGVATGTATISYTLPGGCRATAIVTAGALPAAISGVASVCTGLTTSLSDVTAGGSWSAGGSNASVGIGAGTTTGVTPGTAVISYILPTGCYKTVVVTVNQSPTAISGVPSVVLCAGITTMLSDFVPGGTWNSSAATVTVVALTGVITGVSTGTATISYTLPGACRATAIVTAGALPAAISGVASVCTGLTTALTDAITGGTWSAAGSNASVGIGAGTTTGVSAGTSVISYILPTGCYKTVVVTVNPQPPGISGVPTTVLCAGITTTLSDVVAGGTWTSSLVTVASVATTGVVTGVATGTTTISYTLPGGCRATAIVTAGALPAAISGVASVCTGLTTSLSDLITGGTWSAGGSNASVGIGAGTTTGVSAGTAVISYILPTGCYKTVVVTVNPQPPGISGVPTTILCAGTITTLSDGITGGTWTSSLSTVASVATTGVVTGVATGTTTISYTLPGGCRATAIVTAGALPAAISGVTSVCTGLTTSLSDLTTGGTWSAGGSNASVGIGAGTTTGVSAGTSVISYILPTGCYKTVVVTVNQSPTAISGVPSVVLCAGITTMLSDFVPGGTWNSSAATVTVVALTGVITGVSTGTATISYTLPGACRATAIVTAGALPAAISGVASVCTGLTTALTDATTGGSWSAAGSNANVGIGAGTTTGVSAGTSVISYILPTGCYKTVVVTVNPQPPGISGVPTTILCAGTITTLSDGITGGTWTSSLATVASVATTGVVTGVATGTTTISYTLPGGCRATAIVTAGALPAAISGVTRVCTGLTTSLSDLTTGGTWSAGGSNASVGIGAGTTTGVSAGTSVISYILPTGCYKTVVVTVNPLPDAGTLTGESTVAVGASVTLSDAAVGGILSSSNAAVATITSGGVVTGEAIGTASISYTVTNGCGTARSIVTVTVTPSLGRTGSTTGVAQTDLSLANVAFYPNPTKGMLTIKTETAGVFHLFSIDGKVVGNYEVTEGVSVITLSATLAPGLYLGRFISNDGRIQDVKVSYQP